MPVVQVRGLHEEYGSRVAVDDVDLSVEEGEVFGVLGPNGAGKTTTVECLLGLRSPDRGSVRVLGLDPVRERAEVVQRVGAQLQASRVQPRLRVAEVLALYASFYAHPADWREVLERVGLAGAERTAFGELSGGQQQRVPVALALLGRSEVVVLDELTTGLDPAARRGVWQLVREVNRGGTTVVLVSHQMDEVAHLCDRVAVLARGRVRATGTPDELTAAGADDGAGHSLAFRPLPPVDHGVLEALPAVRSVRRDGDRWTVPGTARHGTARHGTARHGTATVAQAVLADPGPPDVVLLQVLRLVARGTGNRGCGALDAGHRPGFSSQQGGVVDDGCGGARRGPSLLPTTWGAAYAATALAGAVRAPGTLLAAAAVLGALLLALPALAPPALTAHPRSRRVLLAAAAAAAAVVPFVGGVEALGAAGQVAAAVLTAAGGALALRAAEGVQQALDETAPHLPRPGSPRQEA
ncbi:ABC transporter ATP-binding protein [Kineococcus sp. TRM81007]|uniref:ABC transporter ATP-binding protein n=1 Tax=Kineococcus sp. TRM81007 TaxID=2925831 RepID=UPI001F5951C1|nr:ABC transporter ATP-binding protein [Kineococcus sp. TRM81007]MCI2238475.1 ABC transporter ATP-binding protein [Kineococcus sp. TRM81007]